MTKRIGELDYPVSHIELEYGVTSGVQFGSLGVDLIPLHEEHEARLERGISLTDWAQTDVYEKALIVAARRIRFAVANQQAEAEIKKSKREAAKARK